MQVFSKEMIELMIENQKENHKRLEEKNRRKKMNKNIDYIAIEVALKNKITIAEESKILTDEAKKIVCKYQKLGYDFEAIDKDKNKLIFIRFNENK